MTLGQLLATSELPVEEILNSQEAIHAAVPISELPLIGLSHNFISLPGWLADALVGLHNLTGLPW